VHLNAFAMMLISNIALESPSYLKLVGRGLSSGLLASVSGGARSAKTSCDSHSMHSGSSVETSAAQTASSLFSSMGSLRAARVSLRAA
jgi:hypothetical protein